MDTDDLSMTAAQTPFLVPCFVRAGAFHPLALFEDHRLPREDEWSLHAWEDSTLVDLTRTLLGCLPKALTHPNARFAYRMVWFDGRVNNSFKMRDLDVVALQALRSQDASLSASKPLKDLLFTPGTFLQLAVQNLPVPHGGPTPGAPAALFSNALHAPSAAVDAPPHLAGGGGGWRSAGPLPPAKGQPEGSWGRGGFDGRGGPGRGGFASRGGGFDGGPDRSAAFGKRESRGDWAAPDQGGYVSRGGRSGGFSNGGGPPRGGFGGGADRAASGRWGDRLSAAGGFSNGGAAAGAGGWGARRAGPPSRSPSPPRERRRDYSPEPVNFRGGRRPSPTY